MENENNQHLTLHSHSLPPCFFVFFIVESRTRADGISSGVFVILRLKAADTMSVFTQINFTVNVLASRKETLCLRVGDERGLKVKRELYNPKGRQFKSCSFKTLHIASCGCWVAVVSTVWLSRFC